MWHVAWRRRNGIGNKKMTAYGHRDPSFFLTSPNGRTKAVIFPTINGGVVSAARRANEQRPLASQQQQQRRRTTMSSSGTYRPPTLQTNESSTNTGTAPNPPDLLSDDPISMPGAPAPPPAGSPHSAASGSPRQRYHAVSNESESSEDSDRGAAATARDATNNGDEEDTGMSLTELLYGTSSYHAIAKPGEFFWGRCCAVLELDFMKHLRAI